MDAGFVLDNQRVLQDAVPRPLGLRRFGRPCVCAFLVVVSAGLWSRCLCFVGADVLRPGGFVVGVLLGRWRFLRARVLCLLAPSGFGGQLLLGWEAPAAVVVLCFVGLGA